MSERDPNEQVAVRLPLGAWDVLIMLLRKSGPWETVDPLLRALSQQLQSSAIQPERNGANDN